MLLDLVFSFFLLKIVYSIFFSAFFFSFLICGDRIFVVGGLRHGERANGDSSY